jgi:hypothetical protein
MSQILVYCSIDAALSPAHAANVFARGGTVLPRCPGHHHHQLRRVLRRAHGPAAGLRKEGPRLLPRESCRKEALVQVRMGLAERRPAAISPEAAQY